MWVILVLFFVALTLPIRIAFYEEDSTLWKFINFTIDGTFCIDIILTFFTALSDPEDNACYIIDKKVIAKSYLGSWFIIDLISIIPLDQILSSASSKLAQLGKFGRFARFTKLIRLMRIVRMAKLFRICKDRKKL